jgi:hypothetical protein
MKFRIIKLSIFLLSIATILFTGCLSENGKFVRLSPEKTNITFNNTIYENDSINIFDFANIYNGGGVGVADFNNDGLQDLYFTGNMVENKLYLNKGTMEFQDITAQSGTNGKGVWSRGVAVVDINNDGKLDMYVCATAKRDPLQRINILYVNQGADKNNVPVFKDMAREYGLADTTQSTMAYFFDYDNDSDLDLYIGVNHIIKDEYTNTYKKRNVNGEHPSTGRLYRNDWNDTLKHPYFTDVSRQAGILVEGYTHAVNISDFNNDGWQDIFVANDYISSNVLYINNGDGTFTDRVTEYFKHAAANSMGTDAVDINNDGLDDVIEVDMAPQDNYRKKMFQNPISYQNYQNTEMYGYQYQYVRNILQVNQGPTIGQGDSIQHPVFSDMGYFAGIAETDWSWTPVVADFDNDGKRDIVFTNGFPKDITDHDFMTFRQEAVQLTSKSEMLEEIPEVKIHNYAYRNNGNLSFSDFTGNWGLEEPSFSNGAAYADLDNDGDLDLVINNINDPAMVYENRIVEGKVINYLQLKFDGPANNINGIGTRVIVHQKGNTQTFSNNPYRGYLSSVSPVMHFGLDTASIVDSIEIFWLGNKKQVLKNVKSNQLLTVHIKDADNYPAKVPTSVAINNWFTNITQQTGITYSHRQRDFIDFNIQKLLPHKFTEYTPGVAVGDVNNDGLDDFITAGSPGFSPMVFIQGPGSKFSTNPMLNEADAAKKKFDERGILLFDADDDTDLDVYISSGGYAYDPRDIGYADRIYINDGKGKFAADTTALPVNTTSKFCVRAGDYDKDGDLDLFIAGRVEPWAYPKPVSSFIYRNDSKDGKVLFTDVTKTTAPSLQNIGLTCDAVFTDYDNDGWTDLILVGEWMPVTFLHNEKGQFINTTGKTGIEDKLGWWNSLAPGDFDNDGDIDYIAGNLGLNSFYKASPEMPISIRAKDFDNNGSYDAVPSLYLRTSLKTGAPWFEYPAHTRDDMIKQMISTRNKFQNYRSYAFATIDSLLPPDKMEGALKLSVNYLLSAYIQNDGNGRFSIKELPMQAQASILNGMTVDDFDGDGNLDVCMNTNDYSTDPNIGRYDALNGLVLKGNGNGTFTPLTILQSGINISGNGKGLCKLRGADNSCLLIATQNKGPIQVYKNKNTPIKMVMAEPGDVSAMITLKDGKRQKMEFYYGSSFLSQSGRFFQVGNEMTSVEITDTRGRKRIVQIR